MHDHALVADKLSTRHEYKQTRKLKGRHHDHSIQSYHYRKGLEHLPTVVSGTPSGSNERVPSRPHFGETDTRQPGRSTRAARHSRFAELPANWEYSGRSTAARNDGSTGHRSISKQWA